MWHGYDDGSLFSILSQVSKSLNQWIKKYSWNFSFVTDSFVPFAHLKNMHANSLSTWWNRGIRDVLSLRNRRIAKRCPLLVMKPKDLANLSTRLEHLQLFEFQNSDLRILTQLKSLCLHFTYRDNEQSLMLPSNLRILKLYDSIKFESTVQCPEGLEQLSISFCDESKKIIANQSLQSLDICFSDLPPITHLTALTRLNVQTKIDWLPILTHVTTLHTLNLHSWTEPMPTFIQHLHLFTIPVDFITRVLTLTRLKSLRLSLFKKAEAHVLLDQMPTLKRIVATQRLGNEYERFVLEKKPSILAMTPVGATARTSVLELSEFFATK
jgi:hypothetical protein